MSKPRNYYAPVINELKKLKKHFTHFEIVGSYRRGCPFMGDVDVVCVANPQQILMIGEWVVKHGTVIRGGDDFMSAQIKIKEQILDRVIDVDAQVDFKIHKDIEEWPTAMLHFTGSKEHNIKMRQAAKRRGFKLNEYGLWLAGHEEERVIVANEACLFEALGFEYIPPESR